MNLYEINAEIESCIDPDTGEIDLDRFNDLTMQKSEKVANIALWTKNLASDAAAIKAEEDALKKRRDALERKRKSLLEYLKEALHGEKVSDPRFAITWRSTQRVEVLNLESIPEEYLRRPDPEADKTKIKAALKQGWHIAGAALVDDMSMTVR
jgi:hypothetical protein